VGETVGFVGFHVRKCGGSLRKIFVREAFAKPEGWKSIPYVFEANDMYVAEMVHFLESLGERDRRHGRSGAKPGCDPVWKRPRSLRRKAAAVAELDEEATAGPVGGDHPGSDGIKPVAG